MFLEKKLTMRGTFDGVFGYTPGRGLKFFLKKVLRLALLAPPIVDTIFAGEAPWTLSLTKLNTTLPYSWKEQMELFGIL